MTIEITTGIDEDKFIEESEEVTHDDEKFSKEMSDAIDHAASEISEEFTETQKIDFEDQVNSVLDSSEDNLEIKDILQEITEKRTYTPEEEYLFKRIAEILNGTGDRLDPLIRNDPMFRKSSINATLTMLGVGSFSENFKLGGKILLGGTAAYFVIKKVINNLSSLSLKRSEKLYSKGNSEIDYDGIFGDFSPYARKIYEAFISFSKENYFRNLGRLSTEPGPLSLDKLHLLDHAWFLGSSIYLFPLDDIYFIDKYDYYNEIHSLSLTLNDGIVDFYTELDKKKTIPLSVRADIGRAAIILKLLGEKNV